MSQHTTSTCHVAGCTRPTGHGAFVCTPCLDEHDERMADLPLLGHALEDRYLKVQQFSVAPLGEGRPDEAPIQFDSRAGAVRREMTRLLLRWVRTFDVVDLLGYPAALGYNPTQATTEKMTAHLRAHRDVIAQSPLGVALVGDFRAIHKRALLAVDRPPDLVYLGICSMPVRVDHETTTDCDVDLYAEWGKAHARCRGCRHQHDVKNRQTVLLSHVKDQLATASDISRGLSGLDVTVTADRIRKWKERKRIVTHGSTLRGSPLYRVGDVIDLVLAEREHIKQELRNTTPRKAKP